MQIALTSSFASPGLVNAIRATVPVDGRAAPDARGRQAKVAFDGPEQRRASEARRPAAATPRSGGGERAAMLPVALSPRLISLPAAPFVAQQIAQEFAPEDARARPDLRQRAIAAYRQVVDRDMLVLGPALPALTIV